MSPPTVTTVTLLVLGLAATTFAAVAIGPALTKPEHPGQCWMPNQSRAFEVGAKWQEANCVRATCMSYRNTLFVEYATCGAVAGGPGCHTVQDKTLPYPSCCPVVSCIDPLQSHFHGHEFDNLIGEFFDHQTAIS